MALINCKECGREISSKTLSCPNCGCPTEAGMDQYKLELKNMIFLEKQMNELITIRSTLKFFQVLTIIGILSSISWIFVSLINQ